MYEVENGLRIDRFARILAGWDYGWDGSEERMRDHALYVWPRAHAPVNIAFPRPDAPGIDLPPSMRNSAFVSEAGPTYASGHGGVGKRIVEFVLDENGNVAGGPTPLVEYTGEGQATVVALAAGPDGLYFSDFYKDRGASSAIDRGANVLRVRFRGPVDCDGNGRPDECDIAEDTSRDADGDGIPDECQCPGDLDGSRTVGAADLVTLLVAWGPCS